MITLDPESGIPVYQQIAQTVKQDVMMSKMYVGEQLTSVRKLAKQLSINPNTVQKAYAILRKEGIIYSVKGKGDYVADNAAHIKEMRRQQIVEMFRKATKEARDSGIWIDEIFSIIDDAYSKM